VDADDVEATRVLGTLVAEGKLGARRGQERTEEQAQEPPESAPV